MAAQGTPEEQKKPKIGKNVFIADGAKIVGNVTLSDGASVWFNAVLRGDINSIFVGEDTNIQDNCVLHVTRERGVVLGKNVTLGHGAIVHAATVEDNVIVGMNAVVLDGAVVGEGSIVGAGAVVTPGTKIPPRSLAVGIPAKVVRENDPEIEKAATENGLVYQRLRDRHLRGEFGKA